MEGNNSRLDFADQSPSVIRTDLRVGTGQDDFMVGAHLGAKERDVDEVSDISAPVSDIMVAVDDSAVQESEVSVNSPSVNVGLDDEGINPTSEPEDDEDAIDITNPEDLAKRGLTRIQIENEEEEFLLDQEGNIYNLQGEFVGTIDNDASKTEVV